MASLSNVFKIIPVAYTNKSEMDNSILWNNQSSNATGLIINTVSNVETNETENFKIIKNLENTELNTEYFNLKGQYLIMSQAPIPKRSKAYMEIEIYNHPRINDLRHLGLMVGVHKNPIHGVLVDDFCMGNVYYTNPYYSKGGSSYIDSTNNMVRATGSRNFLAYVVTERYGLDVYKTYQFKNNTSSNKNTITHSPPLLYNTIGLAVDMNANLITLYVNGNRFYSFSPINFSLSDNNDSSENVNSYIKKIDVSNFYFAIYTVLNNAEIEGFFNLGRTNIKYISELNGYNTLFDLYNTKNNNNINVFDFIISFNVNGDSMKHISYQENTYWDENSKKYLEPAEINLKVNMIFDVIEQYKDLELIFNNANYSNIFVNTKTNKMIDESDLENVSNTENIKEVYIGKAFYTEIKDTTDPDNNRIKEYVCNKTAFNFYNRKYPAIDIGKILPSDTALMKYPIPIFPEIYFEFRCMYGFINSNYEGLPIYIGLTSSYNDGVDLEVLDESTGLYISTISALKIALFRKKSTSSGEVGEGFRIYKYIDDVEEYIGDIELKNPLLIEQGRNIGIRINIINRLITIYNKDYEFGSVTIPEDLNFNFRFKSKPRTIGSGNSSLIKADMIYKNDYYFFFEVEDKNVLKKYSDSGYIICNFGGTNTKLTNSDLLNGISVMSLYDYYNMKIVENIDIPSSNTYTATLFEIAFEIESVSKNYQSYFYIQMEIPDKNKNTSVQLNNLFDTSNIVSDVIKHNNYPDKTFIDIKKLIDNDNNSR